MSAQVTVTGDRRLAATLDAAAGDLGDMRDAAGAAGRIITAAARGRAPRRTGRLSASLSASVDASGATVSAGRVYAGVIHYGWAARHITGHPFLTGAADVTRPAWLPAYERSVAAALDQVKGA